MSIRFTIYSPSGWKSKLIYLSREMVSSSMIIVAGRFQLWGQRVGRGRTQVALVGAVAFFPCADRAGYSRDKCEKKKTGGSAVCVFFVTPVVPLVAICVERSTLSLVH